MDNVTHTLFAITLAHTPLGRAGRGTTAALILSSNAPDVDIVAAARGGVSYLAWHRGPTHGLLGIAGLALIAAGLAWLGRRELDRRSRQSPHAMRSSPDQSPALAGNATFAMLAAVSIIGVTLHIVMDLPTSYGTRILSPFDWHWFAFDWLPIIDIYLLITMAVGLVWAELSKRSRGRLAAIVLTLMAANYGVRAAAHRQALMLAPQVFGPRLPPPCDPHVPASRIDYWPRTAFTAPSGSERPCLIEIAAVPTMSSPFRWIVIAHVSNAYELRELNVLDARVHEPADARDRLGRRTVRYPDQWGPATIAAAATRTARVFLGFSRFPAARLFVDPTGVATVRFSDMRFAAGTPFAGGPRRSDLFSVVVRIGADGRILQERLGQ